MAHKLSLMLCSILRKDIEWDTKDSIVFLINSVDFEHFNKLKTELDTLLSIEERY